MQEIEIKFKISDSQYKSLLPKSRNNSFQINRFYRHAKLNSTLRLRTTIWSAKKDASVENVLTLKEKKHTYKNGTKKRKEIECVVDNVVSMHEMLLQIGYKQLFSFEKERDTFDLNGCSVEIDKLPVLGYFCEIEGPSVKAIQKTRETLGLKDEIPLKKSYSSLVEEHLSNKKTKKLRF